MIIAGGKEVPCAAPVKLWREHKMHFSGLKPRSRTTAICLHHTGGNGLAAQVFRTLRTRRLSVPFLVEPWGHVYQYCDADVLCQHAGKVDDTNGDGIQASANQVAVGIEFVNAANSRQVPNISRALVREEIHGVERVATSLTSEQVVSGLQLIRSLCNHYDLPVQVPMEGHDVLSTVMGEAAFESFRGVLGHLHLTRRKVDPGLAILRSIAALTHHPSTPPDVI